mmetsp:Transcript_55955/g.104995  ORF Transcript_55955/g.104995 Transcript_55955/m.104995 type:complete len:240 (-) Transcript_55955:859-1578(-)
MASLALFSAYFRAIHPTRCIPMLTATSSFHAPGVEEVIAIKASGAHLATVHGTVRSKCSNTIFAQTLLWNACPSEQLVPMGTVLAFELTMLGAAYAFCSSPVDTFTFVLLAEVTVQMETNGAVRAKSAIQLGALRSAGTNTIRTATYLLDAVVSHLMIAFKTNRTVFVGGIGAAFTLAGQSIGTSADSLYARTVHQIESHVARRARLFSVRDTTCSVCPTSMTTGALIDEAYISQQMMT